MQQRPRGLRNRSLLRDPLSAPDAGRHGLAGVFLMPRPQAGGEKIHYVLLLATTNFLFPGATAPKQGRGTPTSRFRPLNLRVSARASALRSRYYTNVPSTKDGKCR